MRPFLQLRLWMRRGPRAEKALAGVASVVVLVLLGWALVPGPGSPGSGTTTVGASAGSSRLAGRGASAAASGGPTSAGGGGAQSGGSQIGTLGGTASGAGAGSRGSGPAGGGTAGISVSSGSATPGGPAKGCPASTTGPGVTATTVHLGVVLLALAGPVGNAAFSLASPQEQQQMAQAVIDTVNAGGGVQCHKIVATYYQVNPVDSTNQHSQCLQMVSDGVFAAVDGGGFSYPVTTRDCIPQNHVPLVSLLGVIPSEGRNFFPYLMSPAADYASDLRDVVDGMRGRGFFDPTKGFRKVGLLEDDCSADMNSYLNSDVAAIGVGSAQTSLFTFSCPPDGFAPPSEMFQAVEQFKLDGVTEVIPLTGGGSFDEFTRVAQQQAFHPKYTITDYDGLISTSATSQSPDPTNFDGTVSITPGHTGELDSGLSDPGTQQCVGILTSHGLPAGDVWKPGGGIYCTVIEMFADAAARDPGLTRTGLVTGLDQVGAVNFAYPFGPSLFDKAGKIDGGDYWWPIQWHASCTCWKVVDPKMQPNF